MIVTPKPGEVVTDVKRGDRWGEGVPVKYGVESDGEGWYECDRCGLHVGFTSFDNARREALGHDCVWNLMEDE